MTRLRALIGSCALMACGGGAGGGPGISSQVLSGRIGGKAWTFGTGEAHVTVGDNTQFLTAAYAGSFVPCTDATPFDTDKVLLAFPRMPGSYAVTALLSQTFFSADTKANVAATSGALVIDAVTVTTIRGAARFSYDADNAVDGQFTATICP
jgi:hypothetical protein